MKRINFETAKLAKQAEYDYQESNGIYWSDGKFDHEEEYLFYKDVAFPAPYQAELQTWLRNKHNIHVFGRTDYSSSSEKFYHFYTILYLKQDCNYCEYKYGESVDVYEDALEEGLIQGLKIVIDANNTSISNSDKM